MRRISFVLAVVHLQFAFLFAASPGGVRIEVNLGPFPFDEYPSGNAQTYFPDCPSGTLQACMRSSFTSYASQGVTGMRFMFGMCGDFHSTPLSTSMSLPLTTACGTFNPSLSQVDSIWLAGVQAFMADVNSYGSGELAVTPTPSFVVSAGEGTNITVADPCNGGAQTSFYFDYTLPYAELSAGYPDGQGNNDAYSCVAGNPKFVGWNNIYMAINALLSAAASNHVTVDELDLQNELDLNDFTVYARLIYDNVSADAATGAVDVLNELRTRMSNNGFDSLRVFPDATEVRATVALYDCGSVYGDSARIMHLSAAVAAIGGGDIGNPTNGTVTNGIWCGGTTGSGSTAMISLPGSWAAPDIVDLHAYPCVAISQSNRSCVSSQTQATIQGEAETEFSDVASFLNSWAPTNPPGWRGYNASLYTALAMIGETHTTAPDGSLNCDGNPSYSAAGGYAGYLASGLYSHAGAGGKAGSVLRPWDYYGASSCYTIPLIVYPPYSPVAP